MFKSIQLSILTFLFTIICLNGFTQNNYQLTIGDTCDDSRVKGFIDNENNLIIYGFRYLTLNSNQKETYIIKVDQNGDILNQSILTVNQPDYCLSIVSMISDSNNGYIAFAFVSDSLDLGLISRKLRVIGLNYNLDIQYQKDYQIPFSHTFYANAFSQFDTDSTIICALHIKDTTFSYSSNNTLIYRFNQLGDSLMANRITGCSNVPFSLLTNSQNIRNYRLFTIWYNTTPNTLGRIAQIVYLDSLFNVVDVDSLSCRIQQNPTVKWINANMYITVGKYSDSNWQIGAMILNQQDSVITMKHYGKPDTTDYPAWSQSLDFIDNNNIYFGGTSNFCASCGFALLQTNKPFMLIKTDSLLNTQFEYYYDFNANLDMFSVIATPDGGCIMLGTIYDWVNAPDNKHDIFILKVDANGIFTNTKDTELGKRSEAIIGPNPGSNFINVFIAQQIKEQVTFEMFDFTGKKVLQETIQPTSNATISTSVLQTGMYLYRIKTAKKEIGSGKWIKIN